MIGARDGLVLGLGAPAVLVVSCIVVVAVGARPVPAPRRPLTVRRRRAAMLGRRRRERRRASVSGVDALIDLLDHVARELRAGAGLATAVESATRACPGSLDGLGPALAGGRPLDASIRAIEGSDADRSLVVHALTVAARTGGPAVAALDRAAAVLRERRSWRAERRAHAAQARLGASVMTVVPLGFAVWSAAASERVRTVYSTSAAAVVLAAVGLCLNAAGWWWMRRITDGTTAGVVRTGPTA